MEVEDGNEEKFSDEEDRNEAKYEEEEDEDDEGALTVSSSIFGMDPIIERLVDFWGEVLQEDVNSFFLKHCREFDCDSNEHKLSYTKIHKKYEKIVEVHLHEFADQQSMTAEEMFDRVRNATETNELADLVSTPLFVCRSSLAAPLC